MSSTPADGNNRQAGFDALLPHPLFIVSPPRSGSSMLLLALAKAADAFTLRGESHALIETIPGLHPRDQGWTSNRLEAADASSSIAQELSRRFYGSLRDRAGRPATGPAVMIEKTPKNSLRIPFLTAIYPDARFLYLHRDPRETLSSMIEAWQSGQFVTYPRLPDWRGLPWSLLLTPGWRDLKGLRLPNIAAAQWRETVRTILDDLSALPAERVRAIRYGDLVADPQHVLSHACAAFGIEWDQELTSNLPLSPTVVSAPHADKWRRHEAEISDTWPVVAEQAARVEVFVSATSAS